MSASHSSERSLRSSRVTRDSGIRRPWSWDPSCPRPSTWNRLPPPRRASSGRSRSSGRSHSRPRRLSIGSYSVTFSRLCSASGSRPTTSRFSAVSSRGSGAYSAQTDTWRDRHVVVSDRLWRSRWVGIRHASAVFCATRVPTATAGSSLAFLPPEFDGKLIQFFGRVDIWQLAPPADLPGFAARSGGRNPRRAVCACSPAFRERNPTPLEPRSAPPLRAGILPPRWPRACGHRRWSASSEGDGPGFFLRSCYLPFISAVDCHDERRDSLAFRFREPEDEFAIRVALGCSRLHLVRFVLAKTWLIFGAGAVLGIAIAWIAHTRLFLTRHVVQAGAGRAHRPRGCRIRSCVHRGGRAVARSSALSIGPRFAPPRGRHIFHREGEGCTSSARPAGRLADRPDVRADRRCGALRSRVVFGIAGWTRFRRHCAFGCLPHTRCREWRRGVRDGELARCCEIASLHLGGGVGVGTSRRPASSCDGVCPVGRAGGAAERIPGVLARRQPGVLQSRRRDRSRWSPSDAGRHAPLEPRRARE